MLSKEHLENAAKCGDREYGYKCSECNFCNLVETEWGTVEGCKLSPELLAKTALELLEQVENGKLLQEKFEALEKENKSLAEGAKLAQLDRNYVIVYNMHKGIAGSLLFWGKKTQDSEKRSFGGYTSDFDNCEKYTLQEIKERVYGFPVYGKDVLHDNFKKFGDFAIEISGLKALRYRPMTIYYR